jgi:alpha-glucosidase
MPFTKEYSMDLYGNNKSNQLAPLLLTSKGQYVWSEEPFAFSVKENLIHITDPFGKVVSGREGKTLAEAQRYCSRTFFPPSGKLPDTLLFAAPQYNTWIELTYHQNQEGILTYARKIIENGLPPGVLMIDDTWQEDYGFWDFHPGRFPDPKAMMDELHAMGFKVMLWMVPFVSADQTLLYLELSRKKAFLLEKQQASDTWETAKLPMMIRWWNGVSAELDFTNPEAVKWFDKQLDRLVKEYGVDGFKFDAADMNFYPSNALSKEAITPNEHCRLYTQFGLRFPLNEFRACWKMGGQPLAQRLLDKAHDWNDLRKLIPQMITEGLCGYTFSCPDLIGGGQWTTFQEGSKIDMDLMVRSAQVHALMPMMQFSVAPWRVVDTEHMAAIKKSVEIRKEFTPLIMKLARESAETGEPILKSMEYVFPGEGMELIADQFMLGDKLLVAPVVEKGVNSRSVRLPKGTWKADDGKSYKGGKTVSIEVPLDRLPYFEKVK